MKFSKQFFHDAIATWNSIAPDVYEMCENDNEIAWELILDADRIGTYGSPESQQELRRMLVKHSWNEVLKHLAKEHPIL